MQPAILCRKDGLSCRIWHDLESQNNCKSICIWRLFSHLSYDTLQISHSILDILRFYCRQLLGIIRKVTKSAYKWELFGDFYKKANDYPTKNLQDTSKTQTFGNSLCEPLETLYASLWRSSN